MILEIFVIFTLIALVLIWLGYYINITFLSVIGFIFLLLLSIIVIIPKQLEYKTGNTITQVNDSYSVVTSTYVIWDDATTRWIGLCIMLLSIIASILTITNSKG